MSKGTIRAEDYVAPPVLPALRANHLTGICIAAFIIPPDGVSKRAFKLVRVAPEVVTP